MTSAAAVGPDWVNSCQAHVMRPPARPPLAHPLYTLCRGPERGLECAHAPAKFRAAATMPARYLLFSLAN